MSGGTEKEMHNKKSNHHGPAHVSSAGCDEKKNCGTTEKAEAMQHQIPTLVWTPISVSWQAQKR